MRFKPFNIIPSIILGYVPPREDRNIAIIKNPTCDMCDGVHEDFVPIIFIEESDTANGVWACIDCWHKLNTETISDNMLEKIEETVAGIELTYFTRNNWKCNVEVYKNSAEWSG